VSSLEVSSPACPKGFAGKISYSLSLSAFEIAVV